LREDDLDDDDFEPFEPLAAFFFFGVLCCLLWAMLASSAAIRSGTFFGSSAGASTTTSSPCDLRSIMSSTRSRYSSRYLSGSNSEESESISCWAMSSSPLLVFFWSAASGTPSSWSGSITSSPNSRVSIVSTSPRGRIATRFSFERITTRAIATLLAASIASSSSL